MTTWELILTIVSGAAATGLSTSIGYVWARLSMHDNRLTKLETRMDTEFVHLQASLNEIKADVKRLCDVIARNNL